MKASKIIWLNLLVFSLTTIIALIGVPYYAIVEGFDTFTVSAMFIALIFCGLSITAGYHRLWAHKTYQAHPIIQGIFAIGGAFAVQNSALHWASDHRIHHQHVDNNDRDPYSAKRGFWYSHIGWMLREYHINPYTKYQNVRDLQNNKIVMWQHKHYLTLVLATNFGIPLLLGWWNDNIFGMLLLVGVLRLVISHHTTFFINSLAHIWGSRPYTDQNSARDNYFLALLTYGEGYHNFHHIFENDYRNGIKWWHYDPTKWLIKACSYLKLTSNLKTSPEVRIETARADMLLKAATHRLSKMADHKERLEQLKSEYEKLILKLNAYYDTKRQIVEIKKQQVIDTYTNFELHRQCALFKAHWEAQKRAWLQFNQQLAIG